MEPRRGAGRREDLETDLRGITDGNWVDSTLLRVAEAARLLGLGRSSVYEMMDRGELEYVKFRRSRRISKRALLDLIAANTLGGHRAHTITTSVAAQRTGKQPPSREHQ